MSLGNLVTAANGGFTVRVGQNLADTGPPRIAPSLPGSRYFVPNAQAGLGFHWRDGCIAYTQVWRTREYRSQRDPVSAFGAISIVWRLQ